MANPKSGSINLPPNPPTIDAEDEDYTDSVCMLSFNANDPSGSGGISADAMAAASVGIHALSVMTGAYARDTTEVFEHFAMDEEAVTEQARAILEDVAVHAFKVGFVGTPENLSAVAAVASDYAEVPLIAYMPDLSWWQEDKIDAYLDACNELLLPQVTVLVGNYSTLARWLLPEWQSAHNPTARDIARAANAYGVAYTLVTGIPLPNQFIDNVLASPTAVMCTHKFERFEASFAGAGETLSAALAALIAGQTELTEAVGDALNYLDRCLESGFRPGMGHAIPDRIFWAQSDDEEDIDSEADDTHPMQSLFDLPPSDTRH